MRILSVTHLLLLLCASSLAAAIPQTPKVDKVLPASPSALANLPGVFFYEQCDTIPDLASRWQNVGGDGGNFSLSTVDALSGSKSLQQKYKPLTEFPAGADSGGGYVYGGYPDRLIDERVLGNHHSGTGQRHHGGEAWDGLGLLPSGEIVGRIGTEQQN